MNRIDELVRATLDGHAEQAPPPEPVVDRALGHRRRHFHGRPGWVVAASAAAAAAAVIAVGIGFAGGPESTPSPDSTVAKPDSETERSVAIYSGIIERFLRESREGFHGRVPEQVLVATRPEESAGWDSGPRYDPIPAEVRQAISTELAHLTELTWVEKLPIPNPDDQPDQAKATMTLGPIPDGETGVKVSISAFFGFNNGWLQTYVIAYEDGRWRITGTDAPVGIT